MNEFERGRGNIGKVLERVRRGDGGTERSEVQNAKDFETQIPNIQNATRQRTKPMHQKSGYGKRPLI